MRDYAKIVLLLLLTLTITAPVMTTAVRESLDFRIHYKLALDLPAAKTAPHISHVLWHAVVKVYRQLLPVAADETVMTISILTFVLPLPVIIFLLLKRTSRGGIPDAAAGALALALTVAAPITVWIDNRYMIGYINLIVYHNPTLIALRLFLIPLSLMSLWAINGRNYRNLNHRLFWLLATASVVMLATLSKPSYTIALFPGLVLFAVWRRLNGHTVDWIFLMWGLCIPGGFVLAVEYLYTFVGGFEQGGAIMIEPLKYMSSWIPVWRMPIQLALSLVFPIGVYLLFHGAARKNLYLNFSWIVFAVGAMYVYNLYQDGPGFRAGDFLWSGYSTVFVLMYASLLFLVEQYAKELESKVVHLSRNGFRLSLRSGLAALLFAFHVLSGIAYCIRFLDYTQYPG